MSRKRVQFTLKNNEESINNSVLAIIADNEIKYSDNGITTVLKIDNNKIFMSRENNEYKISLSFEEKCETYGTYYLKENDFNYSLKIYTNILKCSDNNIELEYVLNDDKKSFKLHIEE